MAGSGRQSSRASGARLRGALGVGWLAFLGLVAAVVPARVGADEGMWTLDNPPVERLAKGYGFRPTPEWLARVRLASVRFNDGGSGSFVSPEGLVLTNHHVARGQLQKLSSPGRDLVKDGFLAATRGDELPCPDLELNVLDSMEDVSGAVRAAVTRGMSEKQAHDARRAKIAAIEKASLDATGMRSDVVTLYAGGEYWLYRYRKYTDVRLVFAPELQIAFFGGDPDNFTYPRYCLDMAMFRVYQDGKPLASPGVLPWHREGAKAGDLVFVTGHPGSTDRLQTLAQLELQRDVVMPRRLEDMRRRLGVAERYATRGVEEARQAAGSIFGIRNGLKASEGALAGLRDPGVMARKVAEEADFRHRVGSKASWRVAYGDAWDRLEAAGTAWKARMDEHLYRRMPGFRLPGIALQLVRYVAETALPDGERLEEYHEAGLESLRFRLFSPAPVYPGLEVEFLADGLAQAEERLGAGDPFVREALAGRRPQEVAEALVSGTRLADPAVRQALVEGGRAAIEASDDPLVVFARRLDPHLREIRKWYEDEIEALEKAAGEKIGKARFAAYGKTVHPDATFTLRLAYGKVAGYPMNGTEAPAKTTFYGLFERASAFDGTPPFDLPPRWAAARDRLDLATPFDFVATLDIIGGNSGSPVIDREGRLVGLIFDGNIESLVGRYVYDEKANRAVSVHAAGMTAALEKVYGAGALVAELEGTGR